MMIDLPIRRGYEGPNRVSTCQFLRMRPLWLNYDGSEKLTNFQVKCVLTPSDIPFGKLRADKQDLLFVDNNNEVIPYWIEKADSTEIIVWLKFSEIIPGKEVFWLYYGNGNFSGASDGDSVFEFFDDFEDGMIDANKWQKVLSGVTESGSYLRLLHSDDNYGGDIFSIKTFSLPFILEYKWKAGMADVNEYVGMQSTTDPSNWVLTEGVDWIIGFRFYRGSANGGSDAWKFNTSKDGSRTETETGTADSNWHRIKIVATAGSVKFYADDVLVKEHTTNIPDSPLYICADHKLYSGTDVESLVDNIFIRKYISSEPVVSV